MRLPAWIRELEMKLTPQSVRDMIARLAPGAPKREDDTSEAVEQAARATQERIDQKQILTAQTRSLLRTSKEA